MNNYQIIMFLIMFLFYAAYMVKMMGQKKKGIQTTQLGKGDEKKGIKNKKTLRVEKMTEVGSYLVIIAILLSILTGWDMLGIKAVRIAGMVVSALGCASFITGMITMQDSWRAGIPETDQTELVHRGIFKISRNPAFLGFDLMYTGMVLCFFNPFMLLTALFHMTALHLLILQEEKFLEKRFGNAYLDYKKSTGR